MITVYKFLKTGVRTGSLKDLGNNVKCWAHCVKPSDSDLKAISEKTRIPLSDIKEALDPDERPKTYDLDNYSVIIVRAPWTKEDGIETTPIAIFISKKKNNVMTFVIREIKSIRSFKEGIESNRFNVHERGMSYFTYRLLDETFNRYFMIMDFIEEKIDKIEDRVIERPDKVTAQEIFSMKKTLIFFHKALTTNRDVVTSIEKEYISQIDKKNIKRFRTLYNDVTQLIDMVGTQRDIMTGTLDLYVSSVSKNLNETIKTLTVIASFVLIPTLIASIYGMNFDTSSPWNMPELAWQYGYMFSLGLMAVSTLILYFYFKKKGWM